MIDPVALLFGLALRSSKSASSNTFSKSFLTPMPFFCGNVLRLIFASPFFYEIVHFGQSLLDFIGICSGLSILLMANTMGNSGSTCVIDCFDSLGHNVVVGCHDNDSYGVTFCPTSAHCRKCFVTRCNREK
jgi:hypothetical protein